MSQALLIGIGVLLFILLVAGYVALILWMINAAVDGRWGWFLIRFTIWALVTVLAIAAITYSIQQYNASLPDHGSCKVGHYYYGAKGGRYFACDEYYPLPQVAEPAQ